MSDNLPGPALAALRLALGDRGLLVDQADMAPFCTDWRGLWHGRAAAVLRPGSTADASAAMRICHDHGIPVVPQGGNTGLVGGSVPSERGDQVVMSLSRMRSIRTVDPVDMVIVVDAGVTLAAAREAAAASGCLLPLSIASEGSAQVGGVLATNAGGNNTLRYGNARNLVLGLEVVLPNGDIWNGLRRLRKDNTGYCLRQLFVGSEGTLGIITGAVLELVARPLSREVAVCGLDSVQDVIDLYLRFRSHEGSAIQAFEYMSAAGLELVLERIPGAARPFETRCAQYVLIELASSRADADLTALLETVLGGAMEQGLVQDAVVAQSEAQKASLWKLREEHSEAQRLAGASIKNDVSVPVSRIPAFIAEATAACLALHPGVRVMPFGHVGDGNIHFNLVQAVGEASSVLPTRTDVLMDAVTAVVESCGGSFSAEHGIGQLKVEQLQGHRGEVEIGLMTAIKQALDPRSLMNPGKVLKGEADRSA